MTKENTKPLGILMVLPWELGPIGGVNTVVANLYEQFSSHGELKPTILVQSWAHTAPVFSEEDGYDKVRMRIRSPVSQEKTVWMLLMYLFSLPGEIGKVVRLVRALRICVVNAHYPTLAMLNFALARRFGFHNARLVLSLHGTDIRRAASGRFILKLLWRWLLREADAIVPVSAGLARTVVEFEPRVRSKTVVVHNGLDIDRFTAAPQVRQAFPPQLVNRRVILVVGAFDYNKGHDVLLDAFAGLVKKYSDLHLVLIGQEAPAIGEVELRIDQLGLRDRCTLLKDVPLETVAKFMSLASLFVLPSRSEGFGLVVLEAGAFGVPVVATRVGGIPEIISGPEYGVLVDPNDAASLERALDTLLENGEKAREMGAILRERVRTVFSWEAAYNKYRNVLNNVGVSVAGESP